MFCLSRVHPLLFSFFFLSFPSFRLLLSRTLSSSLQHRSTGSSSQYKTLSRGRDVILPLFPLSPPPFFFFFFLLFFLLPLYTAYRRHRSMYVYSSCSMCIEICSRVGRFFFFFFFSLPSLYFFLPLSPPASVRHGERNRNRKEHHRVPRCRFILFPFFLFFSSLFLMPLSPFFSESPFFSPFLLLLPTGVIIRCKRESAKSVGFFFFLSPSFSSFSLPFGSLPPNPLPLSVSD